MASALPARCQGCVFGWPWAEVHARVEHEQSIAAYLDVQPGGACAFHPRRYHFQRPEALWLVREVDWFFGLSASLGRDVCRAAHLLEESFSDELAAIIALTAVRYRDNGAVVPMVDDAVDAWVAERLRPHLAQAWREEALGRGGPR